MNRSRKLQIYKNKNARKKSLKDKISNKKEEYQEPQEMKIPKNHKREEHQELQERRNSRKVIYYKSLPFQNPQLKKKKVNHGHVFQKWSKNGREDT